MIYYLDHITFDFDARQSGKTTRLIHDAVNYLTENICNNIIIFSCNSRNAQRIKRLILNSVNVLSERINVCDIRHISDHQNVYTKFYFDESDFIQNKQLLYNSYYCTTDANGSTMRYMNYFNGRNRNRNRNMNDIDTSMDRMMIDLLSDDLIFNGSTYTAPNDLDRELTNILEEEIEVEAEEIELEEGEEDFYDDNENRGLLTDDDRYFHRIGVIND